MVRELVRLQRLLKELTIPFSSFIAVFCDRQSSLHIAKNSVFHERTKNIEVDCHFVRNKLQECLICLHHIGTTQQLADILTKALIGIKHSSTLGRLTVIPSLPKWGGGSGIEMYYII